jgi:hypothetical protein
MRILHSSFSLADGKKRINASLQSTATPSVSSAANPLPAPTLTPRTTPSPQLVNQPVHDVRVQTADAKSTTRRSLLSWLILLAFGCVVGLYVIWLWPPARLVHLVCEAVLKWLGCWSEDSHHAGFVARVVQEGVDPDLPIAWHRNI